MIRHVFAALSVLTLGLAPAALAQEAATGPKRQALEGIAAIVNDKPISYTDVRQRARMILLSFGGGQPTQEQVQQITGQALEQLIDERLQLERANKFKVEIEPEAIAAAVNDLASQSGSNGEELKKQIASAGINPESLEEQMRAEIAWQRVMGGLFGSRIRVSENQIDDQLERIRSSLKKTQFRISEIFLYAPDAETKDQALKAAQTITEQLKQGADFRVAAQRLSSAPTAATGGDMGWVTAEELAPEIAAAVRAASGPGVLPPVAVTNGVYLINIANKREPTALTTKLDLKRLISINGSEKALNETIAKIKTCSDVTSAANSVSGMRADDLKDIGIDELGEEGKAMVSVTEVGKHTNTFAAGGGLAVMYVCARREGAEALPSREDLKGSLRSRELTMISERELRNLRRDATIIYR